MTFILKEIQRLGLALQYNANGLRVAWREEQAFRDAAIIAVVFSPLAFLVGKNAVEWALLLSALISLPLVELLNSAIENTVDLACKNIDPIAKNAKDEGSAATGLVLLNAIIVWLIILIW